VFRNALCNAIETDPLPTRKRDEGVALLSATLLLRFLVGEGFQKLAGFYRLGVDVGQVTVVEAFND